MSSKLLLLLSAYQLCWFIPPLARPMLRALALFFSTSPEALRLAILSSYAGEISGNQLARRYAQGRCLAHFADKALKDIHRFSTELERVNNGYVLRFSSEADFVSFNAGARLVDFVVHRKRIELTSQYSSIKLLDFDRIKYENFLAGKTDTKTLLANWVLTQAQY